MPIRILIFDNRHLADDLVRGFDASTKTELQINLTQSLGPDGGANHPADVMVAFQSQLKEIVIDTLSAGLVVVTPENRHNYLEALNDGADVVIPHTASQTQFVAAIMSAHTIYRRRTKLTEQLNAAQTKAVQDREINIAVEFMAEQLNVFPIEARNRLRKQARECMTWLW